MNSDEKAFNIEPTPFLGGGSGFISRENRLPGILGAPENLSEIISRLRVLVVGTGAIGGTITDHLARLQPATLYLTDPKRFKEESVLTQPIGPESVGCLKAAVWAKKAKAISPQTDVRFSHRPISGIDIGELAGKVDVLALATDNIAAEVYCAQLAAWLGIPVIHGAVHGETTVAQIRVYGMKDGSGPCPACVLNADEWNIMNREVVFACDPGSAMKINSPVTRSLPNHCSLAGSLAVNQLLKAMVPYGAPVSDSMLEFCGHTGKSNSYPLTQNPDCPCDHTPWLIRETDYPLEKKSPADLALLAGIDSPKSVLFRAGDHDWLDFPICPNGHVPKTHGGFVIHDTISENDPASCSVCGAWTTPDPFFRRRAVSSESLGGAIDMPLSELGITSTPWVKIQHREKTTLILPQQQPTH